MMLQGQGKSNTELTSDKQMNKNKTHFFGGVYDVWNGTLCTEKSSGKS